ncbi:Ovarian cancer-associated gene 2 protein-like [Stylophora pistillata]|uniref:Ovarian cancer-associated gene 2 protein-like n=1 Tax=Stylophora pistillata TaxID=50429 RepID=A0A2B4RY40_STYPI|nr:Ovarian cancer-associated gene 2 protein-like [Stylophora pistillata]
MRPSMTRFLCATDKIDQAGPVQDISSSRLQSAKTCKEKLGAFRKNLKKLPLEFVYITAPNKIPAENSGDVASSNEGVGICYVTDQLVVSFQLDEYGWWFSAEDNTYDPLSSSDVSKGFDESIELVKATFTNQGQFDGSLSFKFAILVAAFKSRSSGHSLYYTEPITCPTLHVFGDTDRVIPKGHFVPTQAPQKKVYIEFLEQFIKKT